MGVLDRATWRDRTALGIALGGELVPAFRGQRKGVQVHVGRAVPPSSSPSRVPDVVVDVEHRLPSHPDWPFPLGITRDGLRSEVFVEPWSQRVVSEETAASYVADLARAAEKVAGARRTAGFTSWKRWAVAPFFAFPGTVLLHDRKSTPPLGGRSASRPLPVVWGRTEAIEDGRLFIEDGFLRSVGLGVHGAPPTSLAIDGRGVHYDASRPSDLEVLCETAEVDERLLARAVALRQILIESGLTKYNIGQSVPLPEGAGRRRLLVPGQVESDASVRFGSPEVTTNLALLTAARAADPDALLIYKPHPDVVSGMRPGVVPDDVARRHADAIAVDVDMSVCLDWADTVETMTSLAGFEALMRGKQVRVHGLPFYAGWGLTQDRLPHPRRNRRRTLDELVAIVLILYPHYVHPRSRTPAPVEAVVESLIAQKQTGLLPGERWQRWWLWLHARLMHLLSR